MEMRDAKAKVRIELMRYPWDWGIGLDELQKTGDMIGDSPGCRLD